MQTISQKTRSDLMYVRTIPVFTYKINYPQFTTTCNSSAAETINQHYETLANEKEDYCRNILYPQAAEIARFIPTNIPPFNTYEFDLTYKVTYNSNCITSLFFDQYTFMGGALGSTVRTSDTWDFQSGNQLQLKDFFMNTPLHEQSIKKWIENQIAQRLKTTPSSYFDDYAELLQNTFNPKNFYLTPDGIVIYFQEFDISPFYTGIPEFLIPMKMP